MNTEVCAAIVTYYPDDSLEEMLAVLRPQVGSIVVVDNRSPADAIARLRSLARQYNFDLIENPDNYGIGAALNQAVQRAHNSTSCEFILFFDQDSLVSDSYVATMVAEYRRHPASENVFLVMPKIVHRRIDVDLPHRSYSGRYLVAQTSGSLVPIMIFLENGLHREDMFIDYVDYEFCLRMANIGWKIAFCENAILYHEPGHIIQRHIFGIINITTSNIVPLRKYYALRNTLWTLRKYGTRYPLWAIFTTYVMLKLMVRELLFENNRWSTLAMWRRGILDFFYSRLGRFDRR